MKNLPKDWEWKKLGEICKVKKGNSITKAKTNPGSIPVIAGGRQPAYYHNQSNRNGNVIAISASGAYAGFINYFVEPIFASDCTTIQSLDEYKVLTMYVYHMLKCQQKRIYSLQSGAGQPHVYPKDIVQIKIPLPPLLIQKQIVSILERAEKLKEKRKQANEETSKLLQSIFLEMFGDPMANPKGWDILKFSKVGTLKRGKSKHRPRNAPELLGGTHPLIQTGEVANSWPYIRKYTQTYSDLGLEQSRIWPAGTLCITIAANIAKTSILTFDACFPDSIVGFIPNKNVKTEYVQFWLLFLQKTLEENAPVSAQKNINLKILSNLDIPLPPIELQNQFASIVEKVESLKESQQKSTEDINQLFDALMQKAFKGEVMA